MDQLALVCEEIARHASRLRKVALLADYFRQLSDDDLALAVQLPGQRAGVGRNGQSHAV